MVRVEHSAIIYFLSPGYPLIMNVLQTDNKMGVEAVKYISDVLEHNATITTLFLRGTSTTVNKAI